MSLRDDLVGVLVVVCFLGAHFALLVSRLEPASFEVDGGDYWPSGGYR
jgi:hypothetical protein